MERKEQRKDEFVAAFLGMCCCHGWLGTRLLPFWERNKLLSLPFLFFPLTLFLSPTLLTPAIPLILRDKDRQRPTIECPPSQPPAPAQIKTQTLPQERRRGEDRGMRWKRPERSGRDQGEYERGVKKRKQWRGARRRVTYASKVGRGERGQRDSEWHK